MGRVWARLSSIYKRECVWTHSYDARSRWRIPRTALHWRSSFSRSQCIQYTYRRGGGVGWGSKGWRSFRSTRDPTVAISSGCTVYMLYEWRHFTHAIHFPALRLFVSYANLSKERITRINRNVELKLLQLSLFFSINIWFPVKCYPHFLPL